MDIEHIQTYCRSLPAVTESIKWEVHLTFCVGDKMFCIADLEDEFGVAFKADEEDFAELTERDGVIPAPHLARAQWVKVHRAGALSNTEWEIYLQKSFSLIAAKLTKKKRAELGL